MFFAVFLAFVLFNERLVKFSTGPQISLLISLSTYFLYSYIFKTYNVLHAYFNYRGVFDIFKVIYFWNNYIFNRYFIRFNLFFFQYLIPYK